MDESSGSSGTPIYSNKGSSNNRNRNNQKLKSKRNDITYAETMMMNKIIEKIYSSSNSKVYKINNIADDQTYALKKIPIKFSKNMNKKITSFLNETRIHSQLKNKYIVQYQYCWLEFNYQKSEQSPSKESNLQIMNNIKNEESIKLINSKNNSKRKNKNKGQELIVFKGKQNDIEFDYYDFYSSYIKRNSLINPKLYFCLCLEYLPSTLNEYISGNNKSISFQNLRIARQICKGIRYLHQYNIIHRDLKPANIFIDSSHNIKIGDFGITTSIYGKKNEISILSRDLSIKKITYFDKSKSIEGESKQFETKELSTSSSSDLGSPMNSSELTANIGTYQFAAPEQLTGSHYNQKADIFSLGIIFLLLFYPMSTSHEKSIVISNARKGILPEELIKSNKDLSNLILRMVSENENLRPSIDEILLSKVFRSTNSNKISEHFQIQLKIGKEGKWKQRYAKYYSKGKLLLFKDKNSLKPYRSIEFNKSIVISKKSKTGLNKYEISDKIIESIFIKCGDDLLDLYKIHIHSLLPSKNE